MTTLTEASTITAVFQHTPYGFNTLPEEYRTTPAQSPPHSPPPATAMDESLGPQSSDSSSSLTDEKAEALAKHRHSSGFTNAVSSNNLRAFNYHSKLPAPLQHRLPPSSGKTAKPSTAVGQLPPSYTASLGSQSVVSPSTMASSPVMKRNFTRAGFLPQQQQQQQQRPEQSKPDHDAMDSQTSTTQNSNGTDNPATNVFKVHYQLEQAGTPYLQFPHNLSPRPAHWPVHCSIDANRLHPNTFRAFIGQVRFETTPEQIAWVLEQAVGVSPAWVARHCNGCFVVHFLTQDELNLALGQHKRVLFDLNGVWHVTEWGGHQNALQQALRLKVNIHKYHLPKGCMVIEPFTSTR